VKHKCAVCGKVVLDQDQETHLQTQHMGPHYFWFDALRYRTDKPSMTIVELLNLVGRQGGPSVFEDRAGERIYLAHGQVVDMTQEPKFFVHLPATM
jgi:hypothetical protein